VSDVREKPIYVLPANMRGPEGNAFFMMAEALAILRDARSDDGRRLYTSEERKLIQNEMMSGDYDHFIDTLFAYFTVVAYTGIEPVERRKIGPRRSD
jgi:hypothetical protein